MSNDEFNEYLKHADSGGAPKVASSAAAVRQLVASTPGAIGFLPLAEVNDSVKVISVDGATAGASRYPVKYASPTTEAGLRISEGEAMKAIKSKVPPTYSPVARQLKLNGRVVVEAVVNEMGSVKQAKSVSGNLILANSAIEAVKQWKFTPFQANGKASAAVVTLSFDFVFK